MDYPRSYNAARDLIGRNLSAGLSDKPAFIDPACSLTFAELDRETDRMANLLRELDLVPESRIAMIALDTVDWPVIFLGAIKAGVIPICLNTLLSTDQYRYILKDCRAQVLFVSDMLLETVRPVFGDCPFLQDVLVLGEDQLGLRNFHAELERQSDEPQKVDTCCDEVAFWLYSSGSTGMPKGVPHVHTSMMETARLYGDAVLGLTQDDVVFSAAKLFFAYGLGNGLSFPMGAGATALLWPGRPTPEDVFKLLEQHQPTLFCGVPTLYASMLAHAAQKGAPELTRLRQCLSAGEALPNDVGERWKQRFGADIIDGVGSTEMLHIFLSNRPGDVAYGTSGRAVPGYDLRLVDEHGQEVAEDEVGELLVRGSSAANGYWNQREKSRRTFEGEWTRTGDKYTRDADGRYHYCGRTDDMFKVSGIWLSPFEVESALISHEAVLEAAVVPYQDAEGLHKPRAFVVIKEGEADEALAGALKDHVKERIGLWKYPRDIRFVDSLPKTATGKIQRFKLRDPEHA